MFFCIELCLEFGHSYSHEIKLLLFARYKMLIFNILTLVCDYSGKSNWIKLSCLCGTVYCAVQCSSNFKSLGCVCPLKRKLLSSTFMRYKMVQSYFKGPT